VPSGVFGVGLWRILGGIRGIFRVTPNLRWEMALRLDFGMISSVGMWPLRKPFLIYLALLAQRMPLSWLTWSFTVVQSVERELC
jgi:hypothetical protein